MDLDQLLSDVKTALGGIGLKEIEVSMKPRNKPGPYVKLFISAQTALPDGSSAPAEADSTED